MHFHDVTMKWFRCRKSLLTNQACFPIFCRLENMIWCNLGLIERWLRDFLFFSPSIFQQFLFYHKQWVFHQEINTLSILVFQWNGILINSTGQHVPCSKFWLIVRWIIRVFIHSMPSGIKNCIKWIFRSSGVIPIWGFFLTLDSFEIYLKKIKQEN